MTIRFAIWTAVSTGQQATEDKFSLLDQENLCRERALARGWHETQPPFIVRGQSRTRWVNLRDAEDAIPQLREMLDAAKNHLFDILVLYDYTRLRDLLDPVAKVLSDYHVQVYSITQPTEPVPLDQFETYGSEAEETMRFAHGFASRAEMNSLRKRYRDNMPARVAVKGLHSVGPLPAGYRKPPGHELDHDAVPVIDHSRASLIIEIKDRFLAGQSLPQICAWLNGSNIPSMHGKAWTVQSARLVLANPYYAGITRFRSMHTVRDRRSGKIRNVKNTDPDKIITNTGKHIPLWDMLTHQRILDEFKSRGHAYRGKAAAQLSRLLECSCGSRMWAFYDDGKVDAAHRRWRCSTHSNGHASIRESILLPKIAERFSDQLCRLDDLEMPAPVDNREMLQQTLNDLQSRLKRWQDAFETGLDYTEYAERTEPLKSRIKELREKLAAGDDTLQRHHAKLGHLAELAEVVHEIPGYIQTGNPQEVNARLRVVLNKITVSLDGDFELIFW